MDSLKRPKKKRWGPHSTLLPPLPLPLLSDSQDGWTVGEEDRPRQYKGYIEGEGVVVKGEDAVWLYRQGFFGKGSQSRGAAQGIGYLPNGVTVASYRRPRISGIGSPGEEGERVSSLIDNRMPIRSDQEGANENARTGEPIMSESMPREDSTNQWQPASIPHTTLYHWKDIMEDDNGSSSLVDSNSSDWSEDHVLSGVEAFYLLDALGCLTISHNNVECTSSYIWSYFLSTNPLFVSHYAAYHYLRSKGWVPKCGLKYASDYVIYRRGPIFYHSSYSVCIQSVDSISLEPTQLVEFSQSLSWQSVVAAQRLAEGVAKELLLLYVIYPSNLIMEDLSDPTVLQYLSVE
eukprot:Ihof_evm1s625 gene=Ihof_evmTU1s625